MLERVAVGYGRHVVLPEMNLNLLRGSFTGLLLARTLATGVNRYLASQNLQTVHLGLPIALLAAAVLGATLLALAAGTLPAIRASRMPARQAIGDE